MNDQMVQFETEITNGNVNHVLLVTLRLMRTLKIVIKILIVEIPRGGRTLDLTKDMNDQMV